MKFFNLLVRLSILSLSFIALSGCLSTMPALGGGSGNTVSGGAAGGSSSNKNTSLESCDQTLGTLALFEDQSLSWWHDYRRRYPNLGSTIPVIRLMLQQSNCFVIVERGQSMQAMQRERQLMASGDLRDNSNFGNGQMVAADYTLSPSIQFEESNMGKIGGYTRNLLGGTFGSLTSGALGAKSNEASTTLLLVDNRSGVQVSASIGSAKNYDFSLFGTSWGRGGFGSVSTFANTAEGKVIMAAFADSYNQMVKALRNYKPQQVKGGLGAGGALEVDGAVKAQPIIKKTSTPVNKTAKSVTTAKNSQTHVRSNQASYIDVNAYDTEALENYQKALKRSVENLSTFSSFNKEQVDQMEKQTGVSLAMLLWSGPHIGELETSKIELESWPLSARQQGWTILGKKITKYNQLFYKYRDSIVKNKAYDQASRDRLASVDLVTKESLLSE